MVIRETENDELTSVMEELIETYSDQIEDVAVELCVSLVSQLAPMGGLKTGPLYDTTCAMWGIMYIGIDLGSVLASAAFMCCIVL